MKLTAEQQEKLDEINKKHNWSNWRNFPNPNAKEYLYAPIGPGVYHVKNFKTGEYILYGTGGCISSRFSTLYSDLPGSASGGRHNEIKKDEISNNMADLKYRTVACKSTAEAEEIENKLKNLEIHKSDT